MASSSQTERTKESGTALVGFEGPPLAEVPKIQRRTGWHLTSEESEALPESETAKPTKDLEKTSVDFVGAEYPHFSNLRGELNINLERGDEAART
jgi:hypothetical protein